MWIDAYDVNGKIFFNVIFRPDDGNLCGLARHGMTSNEYQDEFNDRKEKGFRLANIESYLSGGNSIRYASIFIKSSGPATNAYHGRTAGATPNFVQ